MWGRILSLYLYSSWATNIPNIPPGNKLICFLFSQKQSHSLSFSSLIILQLRRATTTHLLSPEQLNKPQWIFTSFGLTIKTQEVCVVLNCLPLLTSQGLLPARSMYRTWYLEHYLVQQRGSYGYVLDWPTPNLGVFSLLPPLPVESSALYHEATS